MEEETYRDVVVAGLFDPRLAVGALGVLGCELLCGCQVSDERSETVARCVSSKVSPTPQLFVVASGLHTGNGR